MNQFAATHNNIKGDEEGGRRYEGGNSNNNKIKQHTIIHIII